MLTALPSAQLLELTGADAVTFANAQFCNDVVALADGSWHYNAWLNPQGRVRDLFALLRLNAQHLVLVLRGGSADALALELARYRFRSKVTIAVPGGWHASGALGIAAIAEFTALLPTPENQHQTVHLGEGYGLFQDANEPRLLVLTPAPPAQARPDPPDAWHLSDISAGLVTLEPATRDAFLPQSLGMERIGGMSFNKGCYPGQEIVARIHFKGGNKRHLNVIEGDGSAPAPGAEVFPLDDTTTPLGRVLQQVLLAPGRFAALAVLRDDTALPLQIPGCGLIASARRL